MSGLLGLGNRPNATQATAAAGIRVQTSVYGKGIALVYGVNRVAGNVIWYGDFVSTGHSQSSGGKGGGGGSGSTSYTYKVGVAIGICEGPIIGYGAVWANNSIYQLAALGLSGFGGTYPQAPWGYLSAKHPGQDLSYGGLAYAANGAYDLGASTNLPNLTFEIFGLLKFTTGDYNGISPDLVLADFLCDPNHGVGWKPAWLGSWSWFGSSYANYCQAQGLLISPVIDAQTQAQTLVQDILDSTNANCFWSEGLLKIASYGDTTVVGLGIVYTDGPHTGGPIVTYTPNVTPVYDLTDDHFIFKSGQDPVQITRSSPQDAFNIVSVEVVNQSSGYSTYIAEAKDTFAVQLYSPRPDTVKQYHHLTQIPQGQVVAQTLLQRALFIRNTYQFKLGWVFCGLEPMDLVTLTDTRMGMTKVAVRVTGIQEDADGVLTFDAEEFPAGVATPAASGTQASVGANVNFNMPAANANQVVFYEPPGTVTNNQLVLWIGVGGTGITWGGANVWVSLDGNSYTQVGTINGSSRVGVSTSLLNINGDPDLTDLLGVNLSNSAGILNSGTQIDADTFNTLCMLGAELISYQTAALTAVSKYNLSYLRRGAYGTAESAWPVGTQFMRIDQSVFSYPFDSSLVGKPIYVKLVSFNQYGGGSPNLSTVPVYTYNVLGSAINAALANVVGLFTNFVSGITQLFWSPITDYRSFDYEIRVGTTWGTGVFLARTAAVSFSTTGNGTYWVAAHFRNPNGFDVYSNVPASILVTGSVIVLNNIASYDEVATSWSGTLSGGAAISGGNLTLQGAGNILSVANMLTLADTIAFGGIASSGGYALPTGHAINIGRSTKASVRLNFTGYGQNITDNVLIVANVLVATDLLDSVSGQFVTITPQIAIAPPSGVYGAWQNYQPGIYVGQFFKAQILVTSINANVTPLVTALTFAVDLDTRVDNFTNQALVAGGTTLTYPLGTFNSGPNGAATPNVQVSVLSASQGDTVVLSGKSLTQVTVQVLNGGVGVARTVDVAVTGY